mmetsp:Transcript_8051/g.29263  ORF Transcript_8051/g.29263 Transcript_8051/m.29263 type:complete len:142 (+) Transcript_8051:80-505(+)
MSPPSVGDWESGDEGAEEAEEDVRSRGQRAGICIFGRGRAFGRWRRRRVGSGGGGRDAPLRDPSGILLRIRHAVMMSPADAGLPCSAVAAAFSRHAYERQCHHTRGQAAANRRSPPIFASMFGSQRHVASIDGSGGMGIRE